MLFIPSLPAYPLDHDGAMKNIILDAALDSNYKILQTDRRSARRLKPVPVSRIVRRLRTF